MGWIADLVNPRARQWEEFYRNRWQHDNVVRSTHGVNCTGGCSWAVYVKEGIITWEMQQTDYPLLEPHLPPYEPRGCQRIAGSQHFSEAGLSITQGALRGIHGALLLHALVGPGAVDAAPAPGGIVVLELGRQSMLAHAVVAAPHGKALDARR